MELERFSFYAPVLTPPHCIAGVRIENFPAPGVLDGLSALAAF